MVSKGILKRLRYPDLQAKVILILIAVIFPLSVILGLAQTKITEPVLYDEIRQVGMSFAQSLASQIENQRLLGKPNAPSLIDDRIQRMLYSQTSIIRVDVIAKKPGENTLFYVASNIEDVEATTPPPDSLKEEVVAEEGKDDNVPVWNIYYPIKSGSEKATIHILMSLRFVTSIQATVLRINLIAALMSTIMLILVLSYYLRRAIDNERQLRAAQASNEVLSGKLQEIQQELIHTEKLAVMGQLTASFAHEIGTPLNAIGGHMQLLNMDLEKAVQSEKMGAVSSRMGIITGQLKKIEDIVKGFLQTTKKPGVQEKSLVSVKELAERVLLLVEPVLQRHQISFGRDLSAKKDRVEVVPLEIEQVILNLVNNAIDSMRERSQTEEHRNALWVRTYNDPASSMVTIEVEDSGMGISDANLKQIFKPFFTTKAMGEGHGLGLSICQQVVRSYGGELLVESKVGKGTRMKVQIPVK